MRGYVFVLSREEYVRELERRLPFALGHRARVVAEVVMDAQWVEKVPGTSSALVYGGLLPLRLGVIALAGLVLAGALRDGRHELAAD
jgi:hypothetical protein